MFEILGVKRANYYKWLKHSKSERDLENEELADFIRKYDEKFNHTLGYRMMTDRINRDENKISFAFAMLKPFIIVRPLYI